MHLANGYATYVSRARCPKNTDAFVCGAPLGRTLAGAKVQCSGHARVDDMLGMLEFEHQRGYNETANRVSFLSKNNG
jgi:hypothetical protein